MTFLLAPKTFCGPRLFNKLPLAAPTISQWQWKSHNSGAEKRGKTRKKAGSQASRRTRSRKAGKQDESDAEFLFLTFSIKRMQPRFSAFPGAVGENR